MIFTKIFHNFMILFFQILVDHPSGVFASNLPTEYKVRLRGKIKYNVGYSLNQLYNKAKKKKLLCCPLPTDRKMRKKQGHFFFIYFFLCQIWAKNLLKFVFNGLKKHLHDLYMRFDCIPPEFSPFRNLKKKFGKLNSLTVRKKKKKKKIPTDRPNFQILVG